MYPAPTSRATSGFQSVLRFAAPTVALAAVTTQANAAIIFTDVSGSISDANAAISVNLGDGLGGGGAISLIDSVSGADFTLQYSNTVSSADGDTNSTEKPHIQNAGASAVGIASVDFFATKFNVGALIDGTSNYTNDTGIYDSTFSGSSWTPEANGYLGVSFTDTLSAVHYGWIEITYGLNKSLAVHGFAYETTANTGILAGATAIPEPASAAVMAAALAGSVALFRRRQVRG